MNNIFILNEKINANVIDHKRDLRADGTLRLFQEVALFHAKEMDVDFEDIKKKFNAFWVLTKVKCKVYKTPHFNDDAQIITYPVAFGNVKFERNFEIKVNGKIYAEAISEWCLLDCTTRKVLRSNSINYPFDMPHLENNSSLTFSKGNVNPTEYVYTHTVKSTDIDLNLHVNNVIYMRIALDAFTVKELDENKFTGYEIKFISEAYEGEKIDVYREKTESGYNVIGKVENKVIFAVIFDK